MSDAGSATGGSPEPDRARVVTAIAVMAGIALVSVGLVVAGARVTGGAAGTGPAVASVEDSVPTQLAGGLPPVEVPQEIAAAFDEPVIGARMLDEEPDGMDNCSFMVEDFAEEPAIEMVLVTPDGALVSMVGPGGPVPPDRPAEPAPQEPMVMRATCTADWDGQQWGGGGGSMGPLSDPAGPGMPEMGMGVSTSCCDARGLATGSTEVRVPETAAWVVQERGPYWLALPVRGQASMPLTWKFRDGAFAASTTHVLFLDEDGILLDEAYVGA